MASARRFPVLELRIWALAHRSPIQKKLVWPACIPVLGEIKI
jgi:hypothetical protein